MVAGEERAQDLPDVPAMLELDLDEEHKALAEAHAQLQQAGRAILAPPGMDENCASELSSAFEAAVQDQQVLDTLEPANEHVSYLGGDELREIYRSVLEDSPDQYVSLVEERLRRPEVTRAGRRPQGASVPPAADGPALCRGSQGAYGPTNGPRTPGGAGEPDRCRRSSTSDRTQPTSERMVTHGGTARKSPSGAC